MARAQMTAPLETEPQATPGGRRIVSALAHRDFRFLLGGSFAGLVGQMVQGMGQAWLVYQLTGSPFQLSLVAFFQGAAMLLFSPVGGALADRMSRRNVMIASQVLMTALGVGLALVVLWDVVHVWYLYLASFLSGVLFALNGPARQTLVFDVVGRKDLPNAIALNAVSINSARVIGPTAGGVLLATLGVHATFFAQAAGALVALGLTLMVHVGGQKTGREAGSFTQAIVDGLKYLRSDRTLAVLLLLTVASSILAWPHLALLPAYTSEVLGLGKAGFGLAMIASGAGAMAGALLITAADLPRKGMIFMASLAGTGLLLMALGLSTVAPLSIVVLAGLGLASAVVMALSQMLVQLHTQEEYMGRVIALHSLTFGLAPAGVLPAGAAANAIGVDWAIFAMGALLAAVVLPIALAARRARSL